MKYKTTGNLIIVMLIILLMMGCSVQEPAGSEGAAVQKITSEEYKSSIDQGEPLVLVDVRTAEEFAEGYIQGAINIPDTEIETAAEELLPDKSAKIVVYCRSGRRSALAAKTLSGLGYSNVYDLGGILDWPYDLVTE